MNLSLSKRIIGVVIISVFIGSTSALISSFILTRGFQAQAQKDVEQFSTSVQQQLDTYQERCRDGAAQFASRPDVAEAVKRGDTAYVQKAAQGVREGRVRERAHDRRQGRQGGRPRPLRQGRGQRARPGEREEGARRAGLLGRRGGHGRQVLDARRAPREARGPGRRVGHGRGGPLLGHPVRRSRQGDPGARVHDLPRRHARLDHDRARGQARRRHQDGQPARARNRAAAGQDLPKPEPDPGQGVQHGLLAAARPGGQDRRHALHRQGPE